MRDLTNEKPLCRFVILAAPRSGSNMLSSLLNSHPDILCHHELYNPGGIFYALPLRNSNFKLANSMAERDEQPLAFLNQIWKQNLSFPCLGFKMTHKQNPIAFNALIEDKEIKKIVLIRNNAVKVHVSKLIAQQSGIWEDYDQNSKVRRNIQVDVNLSDLKNDIAFNQQFYQEIANRLKKTNQAYHMVEYEKLGQPTTQHQILDYLHLDHSELTTPSVKQNTTDLKLNISNYTDLLTQCKEQSLLRQLTDTSN